METKEKKLTLLGEKLRYIRHVMGLTQKEVAEQASVNTISITRLEKGGCISTRILINVLTFYSQYVSIDVLFDQRAWEIAKTDQNMLVKKTHINSIIGAKLTLMKDSLIKELKAFEQEQKEKNHLLIEYMERGMNSAISMFDDE